ncbi:hypothetical protein [Arthrobacter sp. RCC_34]|uniref:hypothetical protein n=1 Tax=Arthrobacter sp. RCC_34 TaxID=3239230 RepID=UPI0035241EF7
MSSSVVLVAAVAFWLLGIAPSLLKRRVRVRTVEPEGEGRPVPLPVARIGSTVTVQDGSEEEETVPMENPGQQDLSENPVRRPTIKTGRAALALLGAVSLVAVPVTAVLTLFSVVAPSAPLLCLFVTVACVAVLRQLAKRDRLRRVERAFQDAMSSSSAPVRDVAVERPLSSPSEPFDGSPAEPVKEAEEPPLTAAELRLAALAVAREIGDSEAGSGETWEPVDVPKPLYVDAPRAERPAPEPLDLPEAPKPEGKPIIKDALKPDLAQAVQAGAANVAVVGQGQSALRNLDAILQRRRA